MVVVVVVRRAPRSDGDGMHSGVTYDIPGRYSMTCPVLELREEGMAGELESRDYLWCVVSSGRASVMEAGVRRRWRRREQGA